MLRKNKLWIVDFPHLHHSIRGTTDQLFLLREIQAESYEFEKKTFALFIDFKQAYDQVNTKEMYKAPSGLGIKERVIRMVHLTLERTENRVRVKSRTSQKFELMEGVRQGDPHHPSYSISYWKK